MKVTEKASFFFFFFFSSFLYSEEVECLPLFTCRSIVKRDDISVRTLSVINDGRGAPVSCTYSVQNTYTRHNLIPSNG